MELRIDVIYVDLHEKVMSAWTQRKICMDVCTYVKMIYACVFLWADTES